MALVAVPGRGLRDSKSRIARSPSGVAALARPSMLAAMFITMAPMAGCSGGTSGNKRVSTGRRARASTRTKPDLSASRIMPSHKAITPASGRARSITAKRAMFRARSVTVGNWPFQPPSATAPSTKASHR